MDARQKGLELLEDWSQYKSVQYSEKTLFDRAVNIEIEKDAVTRLAGLVQQALMDDNFPTVELDYRNRMMETHLRTFKDQITFELLRNGFKDQPAQILQRKSLTQWFNDAIMLFKLCPDDEIGKHKGLLRGLA